MDGLIIVIEDEEEKGWIEIFLDEGYEPPFKIYSKRNVTWPHAPPEQQATSNGSACSSRTRQARRSHRVRRKAVPRALETRTAAAAPLSPNGGACSGSRTMKPRRSQRLRRKAVPRSLEARAAAAPSSPNAAAGSRTMKPRRSARLPEDTRILRPWV